MNVHATSVRDMGMGLYEYPWFIDGLQTYIYENPSYIKDFKDLLYVERIGVIDGQNKGGILYNPTGKLYVGLDLGAFVDDTIWNNNGVTSLFHKDTYSAKADSKYTHSSSLQQLQSYQVELLDGSILDLTDPFDASDIVGTNTSSPSLREKLNQRNFSAFFAYDFPKFSIGAYAGYATSWKHYRETDSSQNKQEEYNLINAEYTAGLGANIRINPKFGIDIATSFAMYGLDNNYTSDEPGIDFDMDYKTKGAMDFGGSARVNYQMTKSHKAHFYISYAMINRSTEGTMLVNDTSDSSKNVDAKDTFNRKGQIIQCGVSDEMLMANDVTGFVGVATKYEAMKNDYNGTDALTPANNVDTYTLTYSAIRVPIIVGLEAKLSENWKGRFGVIQTIYKPVSEDGETIINQGAVKIPSTIDDTSSSSTELSIGLSYRLENFTFDWLANIELFTVGPYIVSGKAWTTNENNPLAFAFAIRYNFTVPTVPKIGDEK